MISMRRLGAAGIGTSSCLSSSLLLNRRNFLIVDLTLMVAPAYLRVFSDNGSEWQLGVTILSQDNDRLHLIALRVLFVVSVLVIDIVSASSPLNSWS